MMHRVFTQTFYVVVFCVSMLNKQETKQNDCVVLCAQSPHTPHLFRLAANTPNLGLLTSSPTELPAFNIH